MRGGYFTHVQIIYIITHAYDVYTVVSIFERQLYIHTYVVLIEQGWAITFLSVLHCRNGHGYWAVY